MCACVPVCVRARMPVCVCRSQYNLLEFIPAITWVRGIRTQPIKLAQMGAEPDGQPTGTLSETSIVAKAAVSHLLM